MNKRFCHIVAPSVRRNFQPKSYYFYDFIAHFPMMYNVHITFKPFSYFVDKQFCRRMLFRANIWLMSFRQSID